MSAVTKTEIFGEAQPAKLNPTWRHNLTRRHIAYFLGALSGFVWLLPVFGPPGGGLSGTDTSSVIRYLRIVMPLCVFLLVQPQTLLGIWRYLSLKNAQGVLPRFILRLLGLIVALGLVPLFAGLLTLNSVFIISAVLPLTVSLSSLVGIILLENAVFKDWVVGITGMATLFLIFGMLTSHFEPTSYYGRPRILLGFVHPIHTASVILAAITFRLLTENNRVRWLRAVPRRTSLIIYGSIALLLMLFAQSRNILISLCLGLFCAWLGARVGRKVRILIFSTILFFPIALYLFVLTGSPLNPIWAALDDLSSHRLALLQAVLASSIDFSDPKQIFEPGNARLTALSDYAGFASTDSVFQTFFFNYGLTALVSFIALLFAIGCKLSARAEDIYPFGAICGIVLCFSLDAQGVTTSNLILFVVFSYAVRSAINWRRALPV